MKKPIMMRLGICYYETENGKIEMEASTENDFAELNFKFPIGEFTEQLEKEILNDGKSEGTVTIYLKPIKFNYTLIT